MDGLSVRKGVEGVEAEGEREILRHTDITSGTFGIRNMHLRHSERFKRVQNATVGVHNMLQYLDILDSDGTVQTII